MKKSPDIAPEVFNDRERIIVGPGKHIKSVDVPISPEGSYNGNGQFRNGEGISFKIKGFDKTQGDEVIWFGQGFIVEQKN